MNKTYSFYPTFWQAANLVVLYIFIQTIIDFPLALYDYQKGTDFLYDPWIKVPVFFISTLAILYIGYRYSGFPVEEVFPIKLFNVVVFLSFFIVFEGLQYFLTEISIHLEKLLPPPEWFMELFARLFDSDLGLWGGIVRVVIIAPVVEELIFRGVIMAGFIRNYRPVFAVFYSALLFALFHLNPWQFPAAFFLGIVLGFVRIRTGSVLACIGGHAVHNAMVFISVKYYINLKDVHLLQPGQTQNYFYQGVILLVGLLLIYFSTRRKKFLNSFIP